GTQAAAAGTLLRLGGLGLGLLAVAPVVLLLEPLHPAGGVHELHLAGEERVTGRADLDGDVLARAAGGELVATAAGHSGLDVFGVDVGFHGRPPDGPNGTFSRILHYRGNGRRGEAATPSVS